MEFFSEELSRLSAYLAHPKNIIIVPHKEPDGDAIGSSLAWYNVLNGLGHDAFVVSNDEVPGNLVWMEGAESIVNYSSQAAEALSLIEKAELFFFLDFNDIKRTGSLQEELIKVNVPKVMIDHHPYPDTSLAQILISDTSMSSTCELSYRVMKALNLTPGSAAAGCIYAGIMTDTGMLNHNSSHPGVYNVVAELLDLGVNKDKVHEELFHSNSLSRTRLLGYALSHKMQVLSSGKVAYIALSSEELKEYNYKPGDTEGLVNMPLSIEGVDVSVLLTERKKGLIKLSFRSRGSVVVNNYSERYFSGGGHNNAAGGEFAGSLEDALKLFCSTIESFIK